MTALPRIRAGLLKHPLDKQVLVYDTRADRVHLLDPMTACVLELLEEGGRTPDEISEQIVARLDLAPSAGFLPLALEELRKAGLFDETAAVPDPLVDVRRRELLRTIAMTGAAALLVPTVASLTATRGYAQGTVLAGAGQGCGSNATCASNNCCNGICSATGCPQAAGSICTANNQCAAAGGCCAGICSDTTKANGTACTGQGSSCAHAKTAADLTCCSGNCSGTCPSGGGATKTHTGTCAAA